MKMKLKRQEVYTHLQGMQTVIHIAENKTFSYAVHKNIKKFNSIMNEFKGKNFGDASKEETLLKKEKMKIIDKFAKRDEKKNYVKDNNGMILIEESKVADYEKKCKEFDKVYSEELKIVNERDKKIDEYLNAEIEVDIHMINENVIPERISANQLNAIDFMVSENNLIVK